MSDQTKNFIAYILSLSLLIFGFSFLKSWHPPVPVVRGFVMDTPQRAAVLPSNSLD